MANCLTEFSRVWAYNPLYGISRDEAQFILETFEVAKRKEEAASNGGYRTKSVILEIYDAIGEAMRTRKRYHTILDPPPADQSRCYSAK